MHYKVKDFNWQYYVDGMVGLALIFCLGKVEINSVVNRNNVNDQGVLDKCAELNDEFESITAVKGNTKKSKNIPESEYI